MGLGRTHGERKGRRGIDEGQKRGTESWGMEREGKGS